MRKVCFINGSPRVNNSGSKYIIDKVLQPLATTTIDVSIINIAELSKTEHAISAFENMINMYSIVFTFPLYVDSLPAAMLDFLINFQAHTAGRKVKESKVPRVYAVVNCGFFESTNTKIALQILQHFCNKASLNWRFGIGIGAGEFIKKQDTPLYHWMKQPVYKALSILRKELEHPFQHHIDNIFVHPRMPVTVYNFAANSEWKSHMRKR